ncbi:DUF2818 family protein [Chitinimonas sp.]|uniref:DUF2818 family protein n=1 Tax=Chitinimonas sp. TaxID=1934313 RepID=UPI0035B06355
MSTAQIVYLLLAALAANLPFVLPRLLLVCPLRAGRSKAFGWCLLELLLLYGVMLGLGVLLESRSAPVHAKKLLNFYVPTLALFLIAGFPGFVLRYFWRKPGI